MLRSQWEGVYLNDSLGFTQFLPSSQSPQQSSALQLQEAADALRQLLAMRFPRFLSHFMHNESLAEFLDTFLLYRDRYYAHRQRTEFDELLQQLDRDVVLVFLRVVGDEFSSLAVEGAKDQERVRKEYGELISRSKLLTLPRILDVCTLCGENNTSVVSRFLNTVISLLPRFQEDLENMAVELLSEWQTAEQMREALNNTATTDDAVPLDLLQYSTDIACSMCVLLEGLQADLVKSGLIASQKCLASAGTELLRALGIIYEEVIPLCQSALTRLNREQHTIEAGTFAQSRLLRAARALVIGASNAPTGGLAPPVDQPAAPWSGVVFELMEVSLSSVEICSSSYLKPGSFSGDLYTVAQTELTQLIRETAPDSTSADYAISALQGQPRFLTASRGAGNSGSARTAPAAAAAAAAAAPAAEPVSPVEAVKMILPDLGEGFIQACLAAFNYNPDEVVARVLEDNLPPKLAAMDRKAGQIWVGKRDNDERDQAFKAKQRERMRAMEREQEMQEHLKGRFEREYDDDYDDQYDDMVGVTVGGGALLDQDLVRKYNALVRAEESENKYFEDIKLQNRPKKSDSQSSGEDLEEVGEAAATKGDSAGAARPGSAKAAAGPAQGGEKPELTKWQKRRKEVRGSHHRKDRAARKYGKGLV